MRLTGTKRLGSVLILLTLSIPALLSAQSCSISFDPASVIAGQASTLYWSTSHPFEDLQQSGQNGTINPGGVSVSGASGSFAVAPSESTNYSGAFTVASHGPWTCASTLTVSQPAPTCTMSITPSTINHGSSATISWSSTNATVFYIQNIGYVSTAGSTSVGPAQTTAYTGSVSGPGGSVYCSGTQTLTVNPPPTPSCTISISPNPITNGQSSTVSWNSWNASSFYITNIGYVSSSGSTSVSPSQTTAYSGSVNGAGGSADCTGTQTLTVYQIPACTITATPTSITSGQYSSIAWSSSNSSSCTGGNFSTGGATAGAVSVSPSSSTTYTASCTGSGGTAQCTGTGAGGTGALLTVSCAQAYTCSGQTIQFTNSSCAVTNLDVCTAPGACVAGSSSCQYPAIGFAPFTGADNDGDGEPDTFTGHLEVRPTFVRSGDRVRVYWGLANAQSCTATSTNNDSWTGTSSGTSGKLSNPIMQLTTFTLNCSAYPGTTPATIIETEQVIVTPDFQEF